MTAQLANGASIMTIGICPFAIIQRSAIILSYMTKKEIEQHAELTTSLFSYRNGYSTAKDAYIAGAMFVINQMNIKLDDE